MRRGFSFAGLGAILVGLALTAGCGDDCALEDEADPVVQSSELGLVRGRVRIQDGSELSRVTVRAGSTSARTDREGYFELEVPAGEERRVRVDSDELSGGEAVVRVERGEATSVDLGVMRVRRVGIEDAEKGGRLSGPDGEFAMDLPERALRRMDGSVARGEAELRYALVNDPSRMRVPPDLRARTEDGDDVRLRAEGLFEVRFYKDDERLEFEGEARVEVALPENSRLRSGDTIDAYHYDVEARRWTREARAEVEDGVWVARVDKFSWWAAAEVAEKTACVELELETPDGEAAEGSVVHAIGVDTLWLSTAETDAEGRACLEAPGDAMLSLSAFWESADARGEWGLEAETPGGAAMCGGDCEDLGLQSLIGGPIDPPSADDGGVAHDGGMADGELADAGDTGDSAVDRDAGPEGDAGDGSDAGEGAAFEGVRDSRSTSGPGETVRFDFDAQGGERVAYTVDSNASTVADIEIVDPQGNVLNVGRNVVSTGSSTYEDIFVLPPVAGQYTLEVTPRQEGEGSFDVDLFGVPDDVDAPIEIDGEPVTVTLTGVGQNAVLRVPASGGERLVYLSSNTVNAITDVRVADPTDNSVPSSGDTLSSQTSDAFRDAFTLPERGGEYTITIDPRRQGTGSFTLELRSVPPDATGEVSIDGAAVSMDIAALGQDAQLTFDAIGGERLSYTWTNDTSSVADVRVLDPLGNQVSGFGSTNSAGQAGFEDAVYLPQVAGTYTIAIDPRGTGVGSVELTLASVPEDDGAGPLSLPDYVDTVETQLEIIKEGQNAFLDVVLGEHDAVAYYVDNQTNGLVDSELTDPNGNRVSGANVTVGSGTEGYVDMFETVPAGTYRLRLNPRGQTVGMVSVRVFRVAPTEVSAEVSVGDGPARAGLTIPGQQAVFTFELGAGATFTYSVTGMQPDAGLADIDLFTPGNTQVSSTGAGTVSGDATSTSNMLTASEDGVYTLIVDPRGDGLNDFTVSVATP